MSVEENKATIRRVIDELGRGNEEARRLGYRTIGTSTINETPAWENFAAEWPEERRVRRTAAN